MKKVVLLGVVFAFGAYADDSSTTRPAELEGFYVGLGVCWNQTMNKIKMNETYGPDGIGGFEYGWLGHTILSKSSDRIGGALFAGYGKFVHDCVYLGGEVTFDITGNVNTDDVYKDRYNDTYKYHARVNGFIPAMAIRIGEYCHSIKALPYLKLGLGLIKAEFQERSVGRQQNIRKMSKVAPIIGLGIEKNIYTYFNVRLEGNYRFQVKKEDKTWSRDLLSWFAVENRVKGFTVNIMGTYKF